MFFSTFIHRRIITKSSIPPRHKRIFEVNLKLSVEAKSKCRIDISKVERLVDNSALIYKTLSEQQLLPQNKYTFA